MAKLSIIQSNNRIRIDLFNERIRVRKAREATNEPIIYKVAPAEIGWSSGSEAIPAGAREFAEWLTMAAGLAESLDRLIVTEADFGRVVVQQSVYPNQQNVIVDERASIIYILYPMGWLEEE